MNHTNDISQLLDNIIICGESVAKVGRLLKELIPEFVKVAPQKPKAEQTKEAETVPAKLPEKAETPAAPTFEFIDVRRASSAKSHAGFTDQVKALIAKYGAERLSDVKEEHYAALMADLEVLE